jgi:hypothetical protein
MDEVMIRSVIPMKAGIPKVGADRFDSASDEAGVFRFVATDVCATNRVGDPKRDVSRLGTLALLRCPIPRDGSVIVPESVGGLKAMNSKTWV